ncbi:monovalent cation/H+ antiporter complex subunit F [Pontibacter burrus]|uniref:Cation:proton antiporter n=1 Tax=Pontibacter burrus TaxID=2704466 RepID=A0A6B3LPJ9_9BACT|nr:monovalent cation/H+ antiporter complex subunit F [Pontibacter burrus]NEM98739.1 cation:proton antiporter [Pontibacter burrus]
MSLFTITLHIAIAALAFSLCLASIRFFIGPSLPDRITSFDVMVANIISIIAVYAEITGNKDFIDVAIILSIFGFLGSISFAYYLLKTNR